jgi:aminoglycoside 3'-phosphotransferase-1
MATLLTGCAWTRDTVGASGAALHRLRPPPPAPELYLKHAPGRFAGEVIDEFARLHWLAAWIDVPAIRQFVAAPDGAWLLTAALPGQTAYQALNAGADDPSAIVDALAGYLRRLHAVPAERCPFNAGHRLRLAQARQRMAAGLVDVGDFQPEHAGWSAEQVWTAMMALLPFTADDVVTHGDASLDNILVAGGQVTGCIDVGRAGIADRYQDLAILWNRLGDFGPALQRQFLAAYGIAHPDERKLRFHLLLDAFF